MKTKLLSTALAVYHILLTVGNNVFPSFTIIVIIIEIIMIIIALIRLKCHS